MAQIIGLAAGVGVTALLSPAEAADLAGNLTVLNTEVLLQQLPQLQLDRFAGQFSSYDRSGGNNDWSDERANRPGYLYRDSKGERVLAEVKGPGALTRLWFTGIDRVGNIRIYIDNDTTPTYNLPVRELFAGTHPPFVKPWVYDDSASSGGFVSYVRLPFQRSFKLTTTGEPSYYHVGYETFLPGATPSAISPATLATPTTAANGNSTPSPANATMQPSPTKAAASSPGRPIPANDTTPPGQTLTGELLVPPGGDAQLPLLAGPATLTRLTFTLPDVSVLPPPITRRVHDNGRAFTGYSEFTVKISPDNLGVRLIRRLDYGIGNQTAQVYVDGERVGSWSTPGVAVDYNWRDASFDIPAGYTQGKSSLRIRIQFVSSQIDWNEFYYWVYVRPATGKETTVTPASSTVGVTAGDPLLQDDQNATASPLMLTDSLDIGNSTSEADHDYVIVGENWRGDRDFEYAPPRNPQDEARQAVSERTLSQLWLEATWDEQPAPAVQAPLSLFFAAPIGPRPVNSALIQVAASTDGGAQLTSLWPMPFSRKAQLRLHNAGSEPARVRFAVTVTPAAAADIAQQLAEGKVGYFHATYRQEHPTSAGEDYTILQVGGAGKLVGVSMRLAGPTTRAYLEGDERIRIDGRNTPAFYGTGTEDHFGGGWYFNHGPFSLPYHGAPGHAAEGGQDVTSVYRWFVPDPIPFRNGIVYSIEHGGRNDVVADYDSVAFWYGLAADGVSLTDQLRPADAADQLNHGWQQGGGQGAVERRSLASSYEGPQEGTLLQDVGLYHSGTVSFTLTLAPNNQGVILRRRFDQGGGAQMATVRVDGQVAGVWTNFGRNSLYRWADSDFLLPASLTSGRSSIRIEIEPASGSTWNAFLYQAYCLVAPQPSGAALPRP
ncbi:MAG: DUF2961 domain-containing protein [Limnochordaceae bacterium]|nr:DUF2961 domain-containing protein [Limnochordaceae bacterium]